MNGCAPQDSASQRNNDVSHGLNVIGTLPCAVTWYAFGTEQMASHSDCAFLIAEHPVSSPPTLPGCLSRVSQLVFFSREIGFQSRDQDFRFVLHGAVRGDFVDACQGGFWEASECRKFWWHRHINGRSRHGGNLLCQLLLAYFCRIREPDRGHSTWLTGSPSRRQETRARCAVREGNAVSPEIVRG